MATTFLVKKYYDTYDPTNQNMGNDFVILRYADRIADVRGSIERGLL